jgi:hypothetical protein
VAILFLISLVVCHHICAAKYFTGASINLRTIMKESSSLLLYLVTAIFCFGVGTLFSGTTTTTTTTTSSTTWNEQVAVGYSAVSPPPSKNKQQRQQQHSTSTNDFLKEQWEAQQKFQAWVRQQQEHPVDCSRILRYRPVENQEWIESVEGLARALKVALATERRLVVVMEFSDKAEEESFCQNTTTAASIYCQWKHQSRTNECQRTTKTSSTSSILHLSPAPRRRQVGILPHVNSSDFFNVHLYGFKPVVDLPKWPWKKTWLLDALEWDRYWGAFWVRSQLLYYYYYVEGGGGGDGEWHDEDSTSTPPQVAIVFDTKAQRVVRERYARNATKTHAWERLLTIANHLRNATTASTTTTSAEGDDSATSSSSSSWNLYVATTVPPTTTSDVLQGVAARFEEDGWNVLVRSQEDGAMKLLSILLRADFLVGSFASPWFRVATALNAAHHVAVKKYSVSNRRHWGVDIEWLEGF